MKNYHDILFPYAYNILGSSEDAKDTIQDILVKYISIDKDHIDNEIGYLVRSVINQSINVKKKKSRFISDSVWLPEPVSTEDADNNVNKEEILSYSLLVLLEKLTAQERAVFILKESFDYAHKEIADTLGLSTENSRKLLSRAKSKLDDHPTVNNKTRRKNNAPLEYYIEVMKNGNISELESLLSRDISLAADGGENVKVVKELTTGIRNTSKLLLYVYRAFLKGLEVKYGHVNHQPAILFYKNGVLYNCQVFEFDKKKIKNIYSIVDPNKLKLLSA